jgi:hypothetical protein
MTSIYKRTKSIVESHADGYRYRWGRKPENQAYYRSTGYPITGDFYVDYNCVLDEVVAERERDICRRCNRSYTAMAEAARAAGRDPRTWNPYWHKDFHIMFPGWIIVCKSCHGQIEGKPAIEWLHFRTGGALPPSAEIDYQTARIKDYYLLRKKTRSATGQLDFPFHLPSNNELAGYDRQPGSMPGR